MEEISSALSGQQADQREQCACQCGVKHDAECNPSPSMLIACLEFLK